jgi:hypothetical protein
VCKGCYGIPVDLNIDNIARKAEYKFDLLNSYSIADIDLLQALAALGVELKYAKYIIFLTPYQHGGE